jgi:metallo-beta-lactamase family protein
VAADIHTLGGFSGHAGQAALLEWLGVIAGQGSPRVALTHGEHEAREVLAALIRERHKVEPVRPVLGQTLTLE